MMRKTFRRVGSLALLCVLLVQLFVPALADGDADTVYINDTGDLFALAERCSYDAWSRGKTVVLQRDISLGGVDFAPIASFGGTFEGGGHRISGLNVTASVSPAGLFGIVAESGVVRGLTVEGSVAPGGSAEIAGGVAGQNRGKITDCTFTGTVTAEKSVGGIAGENTAAGTVERCVVNGGVFGKNMTGGVVGTNHGTAVSCTSYAYVNTNTLDPALSFDKIDLSLTKGLDSLTSPDIYNVTVDSGGIAGYSDGILYGCRNLGSVGYQHVGYNVGGIAGRSSGHVAACSNEGSVFGRREVGGVVGMAEPDVILDLRESSIEQVRSELEVLSALINRATADAQNASDAVSARLTEIGSGVDEARDRAQSLTTQLSDYWDGAVTEINRGSEIADAVIPQLRDVAGGLTDATDTLTGAVDLLEQTLRDIQLPDGIDGAAFEELSAMAEELRTAVLILDAGTKGIQNSLATLERTISPVDGMSEEEWRDLVYGPVGADGKRSGGALGSMVDGLRQTVSALGAVSAILGDLAGELKEQRAAYEDSEDVLDFLTVFLPGFFEDAEHSLEEPFEKAGDGLKQTADALDTIVDNTQALPESVPDSLKTLRDALHTLTDGRGGDAGGAFSYLVDALEHLRRASDAAGRAMEDVQGEINAAQLPLDDLQSAVSRLRDGAGELTEALRSVEGLLDYLQEQDKLQFETLGPETDASAEALYDALRDISSRIEGLNREMRSDADRLAEDVRQINRQFLRLMDTLLGVVEDMGDASAASVVEDTSDEDVDAIVNGKVLRCENRGAVSGDIDVGGVAGSMMIYNRLDPEQDEETLSSLLRTRYELKCVLQECVNRGAVTGKRDNVGAVCGSEQFGVILGCEGFGSAESEGGDCVGGIAGFADGVVRGCWSKSALAGAKYVGGIVGSGKIDGARLRVERCRSLVDVTRSEQYAGAILGHDTGTLSDNRFVSDTLAGVDRVSYEGRAEPVSYDGLLAEAGVPGELRSFTLSFVADGETVGTQRFRYGDSLDISAFPQIPAVEGKYAHWDRDELNDLRFDTTVNAVYENRLSALGSDITRSASRPAFFVEGAFDDAASFEASPAIFDFEEEQDDAWHLRVWYILRSYRRAIQEQWQLTLPDDGAASHTARYLPPEGVSDRLELYMQNGGEWTRLETGKMGSYLTFDVPGGEADLTVVSAATPWWVWAIVAVFLIFFAALLAELLLRKRIKKPVTEEEKAAAALRKKKRIKRRILLLILVLLLGAAVGVVVRLAPRISEGMEIYRLVRNYSERTDLDMDLSVKAQLDGRDFDTDVRLRTLDCEGKRVSCAMWQDIPIYFCDGALVLENGKAYQSGGVFADYSQLLSHAAGLYRAVDVTSQEANGVRTYHAVAEGETAQKVLAALLPGAAELVSETDTVGMDLIVTDGELTSLRVDWDDDDNGVTAELKMLESAPDRTIPQAVRNTILSGGCTDAPQIGPEVKRLILAWTDAASRDPLTADVTFRANCGPLLVNQKLTWQRTHRYEKELSCVSRDGISIWFTDEAACTGAGLKVTRNDTSLTNAQQLLRLAYEVFLLGEAECTEFADGYQYSITLGEEAMTSFAKVIAPEAGTLGLSLREGVLRLEIKHNAIESLDVRCSGSVRVVRADVPAALSAHLTVDRDALFQEPPRGVVTALELEE